MNNVELPGRAKTANTYFPEQHGKQRPNSANSNKFPLIPDEFQKTFEGFKEIYRNDHSVVYTANEINDRSKKVRIKCWNNFASTNPEILSASLTNFSKEHNLLNRLKHPNIVKVTSMFSDKENRQFAFLAPYYEKIDKTTFKSLNPEEFLIQISHALNHVFDANSTNKSLRINVTPTRIGYSSQEKKFLLLDIDTAKVTSSDSEIIYMAPELSSEKYIGSYEKSSIYSLGLITLELYGMYSWDLHSIKTSGDDVKRETKINAGLGNAPEHIKTLVYKMLNLDPARRPTFSEIWDHLSQNQTVSNGVRFDNTTINQIEEYKKDPNGKDIQMTQPMIGKKTLAPRDQRIAVFKHNRENYKHPLEYQNTQGDYHVEVGDIDDKSGYQGDVDDKGIWHGKGRWTSTDQKTYYEGFYVNGKKEGVGKMQYANGDCYSGRWFQSARHERGKYTWKDGSYYAGEWKENKRDGTGVMCYSNGDKYDGEWKNDSFSGQGVYEWPDGRKYEGKFEKGLFHGHGKMIYQDGDWYEGEWAQDFYEGEGIYYSKTENLCYKGTFQNRDIVKITKPYRYS